MTQNTWLKNVRYTIEIPCERLGVYIVALNNTHKLRTTAKAFGIFVNSCMLLRICVFTLGGIARGYVHVKLDQWTVRIKITANNQTRNQTNRIFSDQDRSTNATREKNSCGEN